MKEKKTLKQTYRQSRIAARCGGILPKLRHTNLHRILRPRRRARTAVLVTAIVPRQVNVVCVVNFDKNIACLRGDLEKALLEVSFVVVLSVESYVVPPGGHFM